MTIRDLKDLIMVALLGFMLFTLWATWKEHGDEERHAFFARCMDDHPDDSACADLWDLTAGK
jgi:hypothetical protein